MDICPAPNTYERWVPKGTPEERLNAVWTRVGEHIRNAAGEVSNDPATQPKQSA